MRKLVLERGKPIGEIDSLTLAVLREIDKGFAEEWAELLEEETRDSVLVGVTEEEDGRLGDLWETLRLGDLGGLPELERELIHRGYSLQASGEDLDD